MATSIPNVNPFAYTNRTFQAIYLELKAAYPDKPDWFLRIIAGLFDIKHWYLDARAQNLILSTAYTEEAVRDLAAYLDYYPQNAAPGGGSLTVGVSSFPLVVPKAELKWVITPAGGTPLQYEAADDFTFTAATGSVPVVEGRTKEAIDIGTSDGTTEWQEFILPDSNVLLDSIVISIAANTWERRDNLVNSEALDKHFRVITKPGGATAILFGNGTFGAIPPPASPILCTYRVGGGVRGNILAAGSTLAYIGGNSNITTSAMAGDFSGGADRELISATKRLAPQMLRTNYRAVTEKDIETLSEQFSASVIIAKALPGLYGSGTVGVHFVPAGGGSPSAGLKISVENYLKDRASLANADIRVRDPLYQQEDIVAALKMRTGFSFATYQKYAELACYLLVSEVAQEVIDIFDQLGVASVVTYVNTKWGFTFGTLDHNEISNIVRRRKREGAVTWGGDLRPNDIIAALDDLTGVEFPTVSTPATIITVAFNRIMTEGTVTVTQIT